MISIVTSRRAYYQRVRDSFTYYRASPDEACGASDVEAVFIAILQAVPEGQSFYLPPENFLFDDSCCQADTPVLQPPHDERLSFLRRFMYTLETP